MGCATSREDGKTTTVGNGNDKGMHGVCRSSDFVSYFTFWGALYIQASSTEKDSTSGLDNAPRLEFKVGVQRALTRISKYFPSWSTHDGGRRLPQLLTTHDGPLLIHLVALPIIIVAS